MNLLTRLSVPGLLVASASCINVTPSGTTFASAPSGARVLVDGRDSGWVTPCQLAFANDQSHEVTLSLPGYAPRQVLLEPAERLSIVAWRQGVNGGKSVIRFPLLMNAPDFLFPLRYHDGLAPARVFVRLRPEKNP